MPNQYTVIVGIVGNFFLIIYTGFRCPDFFNVIIPAANCLQKAIRLILILLH